MSVEFYWLRSVRGTSRKHLVVFVVFGSYGGSNDVDSLVWLILSWELEGECVHCERWHWHWLWSVLSWTLSSQHAPHHCQYKLVMSLISPPPTFSYVWRSWACLVMQTCSRTFLLKWRQLRRNHSLTNLCCCFSSHILNFFCPKDDHLFSKEQSHQRYQVIPIRILTGNLMDTLTDRKTRKRGFLLILILQKISQIQIWHFLLSLADRQTDRRGYQLTVSR